MAPVVQECRRRADEIEPRVCLTGQHREMQAHVSGSTLTVIEGCGHMAPMEAPEAVNAAFALWLEQA